MVSKKSITAGVFIYCAIFIASSIYVMIPLQPRLANLFNVSVEFISLTSTLFVLPYALGLLVFGLLADRYPLRSLLLTGIALLTIITGLLSLTDSVHLLIILRMLQGLLAASFAPVTFAYCFKNFEGSFQAFVIAMVNTGFLFAGVFGQMISAYFASLSSYHLVFTVFFVFYLSCFIGLFFTLKLSSGKKSTTFKKLCLTILSCFRQHALQKLYSIAFFLLLTIMLFYGSFEIYVYVEWHDFPLSIQVLRLISLIGILPAFFASKLINRYGAKSVLRFQLGIMVVGFIPAVFFISVPTIMVASLVMVSSTALTIPMVVLLVGKHAGTYKSTAVALYSFVLLIGASLGSTLAAIIPFTGVLILIPMAFFALCLFSNILPE